MGPGEWLAPPQMPDPASSARMSARRRGLDEIPLGPRTSGGVTHPHHDRDAVAHPFGMDQVGAVGPGEHGRPSRGRRPPASAAASAALCARAESTATSLRRTNTYMAPPIAHSTTAAITAAAPRSSERLVEKPSTRVPPCRRRFRQEEVGVGVGGPIPGVRYWSVAGGSTVPEASMIRSAPSSSPPTAPPLSPSPEGSPSSVCSTGATAATRSSRPSDITFTPVA